MNTKMLQIKYSANNRKTGIWQKKKHKIWKESKSRDDHSAYGTGIVWTPKSWGGKQNLKKQNAVGKNIKYYPGGKSELSLTSAYLCFGSVLSFYLNCKRSGNGEQPLAFWSTGSSVQPSVLRAATCGSGMDGLLVPPHPCPPRASERWTQPQEAQNVPLCHAAGGDGQGDRCPSRAESQGLSPRAPGSEGFSTDLGARPGLRTPCLLGPSFQKPVGKEGAGGHWWLSRHAADNEEWALPSSPLPLPVMIRASLWPIIWVLEPWITMSS